MELFYAINQHDTSLLTSILQNGANPSQYDIDGVYSALHLAAQEDFVEGVLLLLTAGANLWALTADDQTVFDLLRIHKNVFLFKFLLKICHVDMQQNFDCLSFFTKSKGRDNYLESADGTSKLH